MLSIEKTLQTLNKNGKKYTKEQAQEILNILYQLAEIEFLNYQQSKEYETSNNLHKGIN